MFFLSACSGGGTPVVTTPIPVATTTGAAVAAPTTTPTPAVNTFPAVTTPSLVTQRINFFRQLVGVSPVIEDAALNLAAKNHSDYLIANINTPSVNGQLGHTENAALTLFTGVGPLDRYVQVRGSPFFDAYVAETISTYLDPTLAIDQLINSVYHQLPLLHAHTTHIGVAAVPRVGIVEGNIIDIVKPVTLAPDILRVYPANGQTGLAIDFYGEIPDPMAASVVVGKVTGSVMSMYAAKHSLQVASAIFREVSTGTTRIIETLDRTTDPNGVLQADSVFFVPHQILKPLTQYEISVQYSLDGGATLNKTWRFTTG